MAPLEHWDGEIGQFVMAIRRLQNGPALRIRSKFNLAVIVHLPHAGDA